MTWDDFDPWAERSRRGFAEQQVASGALPPAEAEAYALGQFAELLPAGLATPLHTFWTVHGTTEPGVERLVGYLWLRVLPLPDEVEAYVFDVEVLADVRGQGFGRATMLAAEVAARAQGATVLRLNVFGHNTSARNLYESLGYLVTETAREGPVVTAQRMSKPL
jgi:ribosomal protein S18 acetylase RimI-like enzyme